MAGNIFQFIKIIFIGISVSQVIALIHLYFSNSTYHRMLSAIHKAGYLAVPNLYVMQHMKGFYPAFCGGLFFTATSGLFLTAVAYAAAWSWNYLFSRKPFPLFLIIIIWTASFFLMNRNGISPLITAYLFFIPCAVFPASLIVFRGRPTLPSYRAIFLNVFFVIAFSLISATQMKIEIFLDIRDYLLLSNPIGEKINAFYYHNSLYAARAFKSYGQELIRTCGLQSIHPDSINRRVSRLLLQRDCLPIEDYIEPDLTIAMKDNEFLLGHRDKTILTVSTEDFLNFPDKSLKQFEQQTDRHLPFRAFTMISMIGNAIWVTYLLIFIMPFLLLRLVFNPSVSAILSGGMCMLLLVMSLLMWKSNNQPAYSTDALAAALNSEKRSERIQALRYIDAKKIDIFTFPAYKTILENGSVPERYWFARSASARRTPQSREILMKLLNDSHFNVVCMAFYSIGKHRRQSDIPYILDRIKTSVNWYEQWYAYKALRKLGWQQNISG